VVGIEQSGFAEFDRLADLFRRTRELLDLATATSEVPDAAAEVLATQTLPHVEDIEEGFRVWLRASAAELAEMRALVLRAGLGGPAPRSAAERRAALIEAMHELATPPAVRTEIIPAPARSLAALEHARLVFALLPATPSADVHFPAGLRSYGDIFPPRRAIELAERIEELERSIWSLATRHLPRLSDSSYRRTYGFFDAAARLSAGGFVARA
jgi:hypothetical protein